MHDVPCLGLACCACTLPFQNYDYRRMSVLAFDPPTSTGAVTGVRSMKRSGSTDSDSGKRQTAESRALLPPWADGHAIGKVRWTLWWLGTSNMMPHAPTSPRRAVFGGVSARFVSSHFLRLWASGVRL
jgi:hypothetical protein